jgi:hypothetical protein
MRLLSFLELKHLGMQLKKKYQVTILSATASRVRLQSPYWHHEDQLLADIQAYLLAKVPEIEKVRTTPAIGTVTIYFSIPEDFPLAAIEELEAELDTIYRKNGMMLNE